MPRALKGVLPLMANMVEGGKTPIKSAAELQAMGFSLVIFPGAVVRMIVPAVSDLYRAVVEQGTSEPVRDRMLDFEGLNQVPRHRRHAGARQEVRRSRDAPWSAIQAAPAR